ncbi:MAG: hypothetical protein JFT10_07345 [Muribaculaceae bacterium]|uniref:hypothetical protein n=1 Tax=Duncaniella muris TaxID=2094150 RepID=UPI000F4A5CBD|nr:hypothetical protein [Duncaniella muris]MBJ2190648.1 hypothetical protein [Muribaculaceae bacterium]ROS93086.1 hypothetical protein EEL36_04995 [Muribaculaceae bacterium Isolate-043 (Harlan)]
MKLYLLYIGDAWLSNSSLELLAVCTTFDKAVDLAYKDSKKNNQKLWESDINELKQNKQTYGLDNNYMISSIIADELDS